MLTLTHGNYWFRAHNFCYSYAMQRTASLSSSSARAHGAPNRIRRSYMRHLFPTGVFAMADDKTKTSSADRKKIAGGEKYEVDYAAKKAGVTPAQVKAAVKKVGNSRAAVEEELKKK
jgi:hypothetical protein